MITNARTILAICLILTASPIATTQDAAKDKPPAKHRTPKDTMKALVGSWEGTCQTWFQPGKLADDSKVKGKISPLLNGRFFRHEYEGQMLGKPRNGDETIAFNPITKRFQTSWVDEFHTNNAIMFSEGEASERGFTVSVKYSMDTKSPPWTWKTVYEIIDEDHLLVTAFNITPDGKEGKAVETKYSRVKP